uniref:Uncharacterized protein n=1 Tax=Arundo donax TaxID=35708 RepID=A0A0A9BIN8_ARUDO
MAAVACGTPASPSATTATRPR